MISLHQDRISSVAEQYIYSREISSRWARQVIHRMQQFVGWLGDDPPFASLDCLTANRWLHDLQSTSSLSPRTIHGYRTVLHAVWKFAYEEAITEVPPLRLRRIRRPPALVRAYTHDHLRSLRNAAREMPRNIHGTKIPRSVWWPAYIAAAYSTGLRCGCLLALERSAIQRAGVCVVYAKKTNKLTARRLDDTALDGIAEIGRYTDSPLAFPMTKARHSFFDDFRWLIALAGVPEDSSSKWIRRSAISYAEAAQAGQGKALGGHSDERITNQSYRDMQIAPPPVVEPPRIEWG